MITLVVICVTLIVLRRITCRGSDKWPETQEWNPSLARHPAKKHFCETIAKHMPTDHPPHIKHIAQMKSSFARCTFFISSHICFLYIYSYEIGTLFIIVSLSSPLLSAVTIAWFCICRRQRPHKSKQRIDCGVCDGLFLLTWPSDEEKRTNRKQQQFNEPLEEVDITSIRGRLRKTAWTLLSSSAAFGR